MGVQERKLREREALRRQIIAIATEQFSKGGFEAVKMRDIAEAAEYSVGTIYNQFEDKDTLFLAVQEAAFEQALEHMQATVSGEMDPMDELHAIGEAYIRFGLAHPHLYRLMFMLDSPMKALDRPEGWSCGLQMHQLLSAVVNECMEVGALPQVDPVQMSFALWSMVHGMVSLRITERLDIYSGEHLPDVPPILNPDDMMLKTMRMVHNLFAEQA